MTSVQRNITVKGIGKVSASPDQIALTMSREIQERDYANTMNRSAVTLDALRTAITTVGPTANRSRPRASISTRGMKATRTREILGKGVLRVMSASTD
ncbi:MAG: SIMPL domain-containing protein [Oscillospiraceae bacterium]|nr:SIMPL domain-containing protein [Oscillospiraceae bacterium]